MSWRYSRLPGDPIVASIRSVREVRPFERSSRSNDRVSVMAATGRTRSTALHREPPFGASCFQRLLPRSTGQTSTPDSSLFLGVQSPVAGRMRQRMKLHIPKNETPDSSRILRVLQGRGLRMRVTKADAVTHVKIRLRRRYSFTYLRLLEVIVAINFWATVSHSVLTAPLRALYRTQLDGFLADQRSKVIPAVDAAQRYLKCNGRVISDRPIGSFTVGFASQATDGI